MFIFQLIDLKMNAPVEVCKVINGLGVFTPCNTYTQMYGSTTTVKLTGVTHMGEDRFNVDGDDQTHVIAIGLVSRYNYLAPVQH